MRQAVTLVRFLTWLVLIGVSVGACAGVLAPQFAPQVAHQSTSRFTPPLASSLAQHPDGDAPTSWRGASAPVRATMDADGVRDVTPVTSPGCPCYMLQHHTPALPLVTAPWQAISFWFGRTRRATPASRGMKRFRRRAHRSRAPPAGGTRHA
jgi:hypothetical protein